MTKSMLNNVARSALVGLLAGVVAATPAFAGDTDGETTESNGCSAKDGCNQTASEGEESCKAKDGCNASDTTTADTQPSSEGGESCKAAEECKAKDDTTAASAEGDDKKKKKEKKKKDKKKKDKPAARSSVSGRTPVHRTKYPRTSHLPWSPGFEPDDLHLADLSGFVDREVVVTEKLDGENTTIYADGTCHARSLDSGAHPSRTRVKALAARLLGALPEGTRICGENVYARHSLAYDDLLGHFYGFSVWTGDRCWSWDATVELLHGLGIPTPRVRFRGPFDRRAIRGLKVHAHREEGYVVRWADGFDRDAFPRAVAKWVRPSHVQTDVHWMSQPVVPNGLAPASALWDVRSGVEPDEAGLDAVFGDTRPLLPVALPARGETRLALVVAGRYAADPRGTLLPTLVRRLPPATARHAADLVGLARHLHVPLDDAARVGGLVSLGRAVDLAALHGLAEALATDAGAWEQVAWSRAVAEDAGLLADPLHARWLGELDLPEDPVLRAWLAGRALDARARGRLVHPAEAVAVLHPLRERVPPVLTVLVGPSGCGKSTLARSIDGEPIALDDLREDDVERPVNAALARLETTLAAGRSAVWDATSLTPSQRGLPVGVARRREAMVRLVSVLTPRPTAEARNQARSRTVPADVVERQWRRVRWPYAYEADALEDVVADG